MLSRRFDCNLGISMSSMTYLSILKPFLQTLAVESMLAKGDSDHLKQFYLIKTDRTLDLLLKSVIFGIKLLS